MEILVLILTQDVCEHHFSTQIQASSCCVRLEFEILSNCQILMRFYIILTACAELGRMTLHWEVRIADKDLCVLFLPFYSVHYAIFLVQCMLCSDRIFVLQCSNIKKKYKKMQCAVQYSSVHILNAYKTETNIIFVVIPLFFY